MTTLQARPFARIAILGAGAWGTALATIAARAGRRAALWTRSAEQARRIRETRRNPDYLGDVALPDGIDATDDLSAALDGAELALIATPSSAAEDAAAALAAADRSAAIPVLICSKGFAREGGRRLSEAVGAAASGHAVGALSGPTFAAEAARGLPTAAVIAAPEAGEGAGSLAARAAATLSGPDFRP